MNVLAVGLGVTGLAVARHAAAQGWRCVVTEDGPARRRAEAEALGAEVVEAPDEDALRRLVTAADLVVPSPGVAVAHPVYAVAASTGTRLVSEIELASEAASVPIVAVTGTNGKTTVTTLVTEMLRASGRRALAAGNIGRPLLEAVEDPVAGGEPLDVVVAEVSSFQLQFTERFRPRVAVVLNLADDHLDWHPSFAHYRDAKARVFANQRDGDVAVLNADDPATAAMAAEAPARVVRFSAAGRPDAFRVDAGHLVTDAGEVIVALDDLPERAHPHAPHPHAPHPHEIANALAASAAALAAGATLPGAAATLRAHPRLPHRLTLVGEAGGVRWYDDSKATNPHATLAALAGFDSVVLLAGGRNKGLSLEPLREGAGPLRAVVAFGEAGPEVEAVFAGLRPVDRVTSVREAVAAAAARAEPGDAVLLSPACASFDAYADYAARGDDFAAEVRALISGDGR